MESHKKSDLHFITQCQKSHNATSIILYWTGQSKMFIQAQSEGIYNPLLNLLPQLSLPNYSQVIVSVFFILMSLVIFYLLVCFVVQVPLIGEIIRYFVFNPWTVLLSIMLSSSIHAVPKGRSSLFLLCSIPSYKRTSFLIHSFTDGHLGCFQHLAIVNCAAMNIGVHRFF